MTDFVLLKKENEKIMEKILQLERFSEEKKKFSDDSVRNLWRIKKKGS